MIANVIVDVPAQQIDRTFDYEIPPRFEQVVQPGVRVAVPFGPRKVQGFVVSLSETSQFDRLKPISDVFDIKPVLTSELLELGDWLSVTTLCFKVTALQAMLPAALRAKYEKTLSLSDSIDKETLSPEVRQLFSRQNVVRWDELQKSAHEQLLKDIQRHIKNHQIVVNEHVGSKATMKKVRVVEKAVSDETLKETLENWGNTAKKQREVLEYVFHYSEVIVVSELVRICETSSSVVKALVDKGLLHEKVVEQKRDPFEGRSFGQTEPMALTSEQQQVMTSILRDVQKETHRTFLLRGVTGSGKTEVYLQAIEAVLQKGKEAIVLVPEISLTPQMVTRFKERFGSDVAVLHSGLSQGEKFDEWRKIRDQEVNVAVGARSAIFAPFTRLGMVIIDEEHETSYKQEEMPRYHARDVAIARGKYHKCPVVLGSATPSLESYARAQKGVYESLEMAERVNNIAMPSVHIVDMREELRSGNRSMFSNDLIEGMKTRIERGEQTVLFLNRRGYSTFVMCRDCGHVVQCPHCDISLTYHRSTGSLDCHYCGYRERVPNTCPSCESEAIRFFGSGTQKVEEALNDVLPEARVIRMDVDTTKRKGAHEKLLNAFGRGDGDILLGTQMIAKGLDFPNVTLVGILAADTMLHLPDFRATERTFQLLTQVSGRAGRHEKEGEVVVQTYDPEHYSIQLMQNHDFVSFFQREMLTRKRGQYPPYMFLTVITVSDTELMKVAQTTDRIAQFLKERLQEPSVVLGPVASPIPRINDRYRHQCVIKYKHEPKLTSFLQDILSMYQTEMTRTDLTITIDQNPYMMM
ncbi:primosomal protein N' [Texcoconibacillus texcoconensis]|uniref:Replication restart protein PriA n=1 Tax=Texcoconibacillus texcoconensis TaxID=1095777 RepID=A0A840QL92_9BACI|nr:primosomal protein N' [Texcoconibacillus texcoconensis]MBB5172132.1 primosomal protein N' (replication factor Y) [Texcoconibacillus texcoconensis]